MIQQKGSNCHILSVANAEKIGFIGDSYTESHFSIEGKAYICKLSLFSDYNYENFAKSGDTYRGNLDRMRKGMPIYHEVLSWKDFKPKYAFMVSYTNDLKYMDEEQYYDDLRAVIETVKGLGAIPIVATEYHSSYGAGLPIGLRQVAKEYDCEFIDILGDVERTRGGDYAPFWSGTHPGTRTNHLMSDNFERYLNQLPRPRQSLKVFRPRRDYHHLDELIFNTNEERAKLFKEINIGHNALVDLTDVDNVTSASHHPITSEYLKLQNGEDVGFTDLALISAVLPSSSLGLQYVALDLGDLDAKVYVKDIMARPYAEPTFYQRFDLEDNAQIEVGDVYTSDNPHFEGIEFTIKEVEGQSVLALPYPRIATNNPGVLTKVSGKGDEKINYPYTAIGFMADYPRGKANIGHYIQIQKQEDKYIIPEDLLVNCVDYDKVHFLVVKEGEFALNTVKVEWLGEENKVYRANHMKVKRAKGNELVKAGTVGHAEESKNWTVAGGEMPYIPADKCLPKGVAACIDLSQEGISQGVTYEESDEAREVEISVIARYFPGIYEEKERHDEGLITLNSYDYGELNIDLDFSGKVHIKKNMDFSRKVFTLRERVGLHWKEVIFRTILPAHTKEVDVRIYAKGKQLQFARFSMREV